MANTNPLETLKIKKLIGFKQITPGVITGELITALKQCGIDAVTGYSQYSSEFSIGRVTVLGNTFYGFKVATEKAKSTGYFTVRPVSDVVKLKEKPVQIGFRLTQSAVSQKNTSVSMLSFSNLSQIALTPRITANTEDSSVYYEVVLSVAKDSRGNDAIVADVYVNKQKFSKGSALINTTSAFLMQLGGQLVTDTEAGFSYMVGDMYVAELDYNSDGTVTPQLLGNLTLEPFSVASYTGDKHTNTKNQDIVTALNTLDPNNDMGVLAIKPVEQAASVTFNAPDIAGKSIYGAALNIVYKDSIAPNNRLSYQITEGTTQLPEQTITEHNADVAGFTTVSKILTVPANGGDWNAENLRFKLDMFNRGTDAE
ncbi:hypothetical protein ZQ65_24650 [Salmonella enterica subsp. enterica serovar Newport]|uniref:Uncharacterized protein n=1 Tax=Salmonella newport TaxID=108619 RepID=A0A5U9KZ71_SALNE|nr:hypothetical protein [Salmonella enterica subsp. enterica serovar Newport]ECN8542879.1 hypothetical protein [Salmonella enterica subsp. enterica serovar Newport]EJH8886492.1 hypothetical protein [Salmonella enterica]